MDRNPSFEVKFDGFGSVTARYDPERGKNIVSIK